MLKMDCEGCEYDSILNTDDEILKKFSTIILEYHYGYQNLVEKLETTGRINLTIFMKIFTMRLLKFMNSLKIGIQNKKIFRQF